MDNLELISKMKLHLESNPVDSIIVSCGNECFHIKTFGENKELHETRSLSKIIISLAIGKWLEENEDISLNTNVWPYLVKKQDTTVYHKTTIKDLLIQSAGYSNSTLLMGGHTAVKKEEYLRLLMTLEQDFLPGTRFVYSNASYYLLSVLFQRMSSISIYEYIRQTIFDDLEIYDSEWENWGEFCAGSTGLYLKPSDVHKIGLLILNNGVYKGKKVISSSYINEMKRKQITLDVYRTNNPLKPIGYGYGLWYVNPNVHYISGANGQYIIVDERKGIVITIMSTGEIYPMLSQIQKWLL